MLYNNGLALIQDPRHKFITSGNIRHTAELHINLFDGMLNARQTVEQFLGGTGVTAWTKVHLYVRY